MIKGFLQKHYIDAYFKNGDIIFTLANKLLA